MDRKKDKRLEEARRKGRKRGKTDVKENKNCAPLFIGTQFSRVGLCSSSFDKVERRLIYAEGSLTERIRNRNNQFSACTIVPLRPHAQLLGTVSIIIIEREGIWSFNFRCVFCFQNEKTPRDHSGRFF
jgi:hypothetical protein